MPRTITALICTFCTLATARSHDIHPRSEPTYTITAPAAPAPGKPLLRLHTMEGDDRVPARFTILVDGKPWAPDALNEHGLRFTSIHTGKKQSATVLYSRGTGPLECNLPSGAAKIEIAVTRGIEYLPIRIPLPLENSSKTHNVTATLLPWSNLRKDGWISCDEHLHYERSDPEHDADWFTMLAADGLDQGFFMVLDGGNLPGPWSQQYAYGKEGRTTRDGRHLIPGEEFRGSLQGHNNLHGIAQVLHPISVGRPNSKIPRETSNWPATHDVLKKVTATGGIGGPAHGGAFGKASTAIRDAVLGASEFFELANTHLYVIDPWYRLLNCGYLLPPVAGTDLPNFPWRTPTDPFFGETRTYVRVDDPATATFEHWKKSLRSGHSFITSGPLPSFSINRKTIGEGALLPRSGDYIEIEAELSSPFPITSMEIVQNGIPLPFDPVKSRDENGVHRWSIRESIQVEKSSWFALRGRGLRKNHLWAEIGIVQHSIAHTAAAPIIVDERPIFDPETAITLIADLEAQRETYATSGSFPNGRARGETLRLFDLAVMGLQRRVRSQPSRR